VLGLCRSHLQVRPTSAPLFGVRCKSDDDSNEWVWLSADEKVADLPQVCKNSLQLRLRFKLPKAESLHELDKAAFDYYYQQVMKAIKRPCINYALKVRRDFISGDAIKANQGQAKRLAKSVGKTKPSKWAALSPATYINVDSAEEKGETEERAQFYTTITSLASILMALDALEGGKESADKYLPKEMYGSKAERLMGFRKVRTYTEKMVERFLKEEKASSIQLKRHFLTNVETEFEANFEEVVPAMRRLPPENWVKVSKLL